MKCDIIVLADDRGRLARTLASVVRNASRREVGRIVVGWNGEDQYEAQDVDLFGFGVAFESLRRGEEPEFAEKWRGGRPALLVPAGAEVSKAALRAVKEAACRTT